MRAVFMLALALAACAARPAAPIELSTIATGGYARDESGRQAVLASSQDEYRRLWAEKIGDEPAPEVDLGKGVVVFLLAGQRSTGGYSVVPESVEVSEGTAVVFITSRDVGSVQWPQ